MTHPKPHSLIAKTLHWGFIAVFVYAIIKQIDGIEELSDPALLRFEIIFAFGFLLLLLVRFVYMRLTRPTALPDDTPKHMRLMARAGHLAIYVSLSMIAISGLLIGLLYQMGGPEATGMGLAIGLHEVCLLYTSPSPRDA